MSKRYKCPYCDYLGDREKLVTHINRQHEDEIPEHYTARRIVFNLVNHREQGVCMVCKGPTPWNEKAGKYDKLCGKESCKRAIRKQYEERMLRVHGTTNLLDDPEYQEKKMLANRKISKTYTYSDGTKFTYTAAYEGKLLEFEDKVLQLESKDIMMPGPILEYEFKGKKHHYISDQLLIPWNLIIEVKDGGSNPNNRPMDEYREKQVAKETMITDMGTYNYLRLTDNQFGQLLGILLELKQEMMDDSEENRKAIIRIHETGLAGSPAGNVMPNNSSVYILPYGHLRKGAFNPVDDDIEGYAITNDLFNDKILVVKDAKIKVESISFLEDRSYSIYQVLNKTLSELVTSKEVSDTYFLEAITGNTCYTKDILDYSDKVKRIYLENHSAYMHTIKQTIADVNRSLIGNSRPYIVQEGTIANYISNRYYNLELVLDEFGEYVRNKKSGARSGYIKDISLVEDSFLEALNNISYSSLWEGIL